MPILANVDSLLCNADSVRSWHAVHRRRQRHD